MSKHTKTPWKVDGTVDMLISTEDGAIIADVCGTISSFEEDEANAKHICHCVNNHDKLVEALERVEKFMSLSYSGKTMQWNEEDVNSYFCGTREKVQQALAEAKEMK